MIHVAGYAAKRYLRVCATVAVGEGAVDGAREHLANALTAGLQRGEGHSAAGDRPEIAVGRFCKDAQSTVGVVVSRSVMVCVPGEVIPPNESQVSMRRLILDPSHASFQMKYEP